MLPLGVSLACIVPILVCTTSVVADEASFTSVNEILTTDPEFLDLDKVAGLAERRIAHAEKVRKGGRPIDEGVALLEAGALAWFVGDAVRSSADGGVPFICHGFHLFRRAVDVLREAGPGAEPLRFDAQLRYAEVMGTGFWYCGVECDLLDREAVRLAESAAAAARRNGDPSGVARALTTLAKIRRYRTLREETRGHQPGILNLPQFRDDAARPAIRALLEESVRIELATGVWTRSLVASLVTLAEHHAWTGHEGVSAPLAEVAASGAAVLGLRRHDRLVADINRLYRHLQEDPAVSRDEELGAENRPAGSPHAIATRHAAEIERILSSVPADAPPAAPPPASCDLATLRTAAAKQLEHERRVLIAALDEGNEVEFRGFMRALPAEERLFDEVLRCDIRDQQVLRNVVERVLLRRQIWRFRTAHMNRVRESADPELRETIETLRELRRRRAEYRLTRRDPPPPTDPLRWAVCTDDEKAEPPPRYEFLELEAQIDDLERRLMRDVSAGTIRNIEELWPDLLSSLGSDAAVVGYLPAVAPNERRVVAFVVDGADAVAWADVGSESEIDVRFAEQARGGLVRDMLRPAGKALVDPLEKHLQGKKRIHLLAAGPVRFLPWSALRDRDGRHLGERFSISWLQWAGDTYHAAGNAPNSHVLFLAPEYDPHPGGGGEWPRVVPPAFEPLQWSHAEVESLTRRLEAGGIRAEAILGDAATERAMRRIASPRVLQIAAHGLLVEHEVSLSGNDEETERARWLNYGLAEADLEPSLTRVLVALAGANRLLPSEEGDGLLTAAEAADLDLQGTRLVVLSGCVTASPSLQDGSGAYDLALGFRMAGATSAVASLWRVADDASRLLMDEFYGALLDGLPVADALWRAKGALRRSDDFSDPRFWAAFEVFGQNLPVWPKAERVADGASIAGAIPPMRREAQFLVREPFLDDRNAWQAIGPRGRTAIRDGRYEVQVEAGGWQFATIPVQLPEKQDFDLSVTVTKLAGSDSSSFGFVFDFRDEDNYRKFTISGDGHVSIASAGKPLTVLLFPDEERKEVHRSNATNVLRMTTREKSMRFFINDREIAAIPWRWEWTSPRIGFLVNDDLTVAFDDFEITVPGSAGQ